MKRKWFLWNKADSLGPNPTARPNARPRTQPPTHTHTHPPTHAAEHHGEGVFRYVLVVVHRTHSLGDQRPNFLSHKLHLVLHAPHELASAPLYLGRNEPSQTSFNLTNTQ